MNNIPSNWEELELLAERLEPRELKKMVCPICEKALSVEFTKDRKTVRLSCQNCSKKTVICGLPNKGRSGVTP